MEKHYKILGMSCSGCQKKISEKLNSIEGLYADVDLATEIVTLNSSQPIDLEQLNISLADIGNYKLIDDSQPQDVFIKPQDRVSPSSVYYCPMECEGEKVYFAQGKRCPTCNMFLVPIEEKLEKDPNFKPTYSKNNLPEIFIEHEGDFYCPMFCEGDKVYNSNVGCPVCQMHLEKITPSLLQNASFVKKPSNIDNTPNLETPKITDDMAGKYYCPMFCEGDKVYDSNVGCPVCGMDLVKYPEKGEESSDDETFTLLKKKFYISILFTIPVFILSMGGMFINFPISDTLKGYLEMVLTLPVLFYSGWFIMKRGWNSFKTWNLNMFSLIALGIAAALLFSLVSLLFPSILPHEIMDAHHSRPLYFEAICVIITLVILGQLMEAAAHKKTGNAIKELMNLSPETANLIIENTEKIIPLSEVLVGNILKVKPGEKIPVDGSIVDGSSSIDESMITGESIPIEKIKNDKVIAGTINGNGVFTMKAEKIGSQTLLSQIITLVNEASRSKAPIQKLTDKVAKIFVPTVVLVAITSFILWNIFGPEGKRMLYGFVNAVAVLIVACPCALGLATPMSLMVGIGKGAKNGILIKNAEALEQMNKVNVLITDKTGTLTEGKPSIEEIFTTGNNNRDEILKYAYALNSNSLHPLSTAVINEAEKKSITLEKVTQFENISGKGIKGIINNKTYYLGNKLLLNDIGVEIPAEFEASITENEEKARTISYLVQDKNVLGFISFSDKIKNSSRDAVQFLLKEGIEIIMMTGDNEATARAVAKELGIKNYFANCLPEDKIQEVKKLQAQGKTVAMIGDGINDSPALAQANVGIAMGTGTDIAIESAEITLLKGDLSGVSKTKILSEKLLKNIKENLFFAFVYNVFGIPIAAGLLYPFFGILLSPMIAAAAMSLSSVSVIVNSLRLNTINLTRK